MRIMSEAFQMAATRDRLDEMSRLDVSDDSDGLPFRVVVNSPDPNSTPHAHILTFEPKEKELGAFVLTENPPRCVDDFVEYNAGPHKGLRDVPDAWLEMIVKWARKRNGKNAAYGVYVSNWTAMRILYRFSSARPPRRR